MHRDEFECLLQLPIMVTKWNFSLFEKVMNSNNRSEMCKVLMESVTSSGETALHFATKIGKADLIEYIYNFIKETDLNTVDTIETMRSFINKPDTTYGDTAYITACKNYSNSEVFDVLVKQCGIDVTTKNWDQKNGSEYLGGSRSEKKLKKWLKKLEKMVEE